MPIASVTKVEEDPTPVEVWADVFERGNVFRGGRLNREVVFAAFEIEGKRWCRLCERRVAFTETDEHVREHDRELREWRARSKRGRDAAATRNLKQINKLRRETSRASDDAATAATSDGRDDPGQNRKVTMSTTTKKGTTRRQLPEAGEEALVKAISETFADRTEDFRQGAIIYGRKLLKHQAGLRATPPPIPPALQSKDKATTARTCASVAEVIGAKVGAADATEKAASKRATATPEQDATEKAPKRTAKATPKTPPAKSRRTAKATSEKKGARRTRYGATARAR